ncbi:unnamed protein product [Owenia fusiformis]|uniref:Uncharacterized protein n=1 Tax=Owenia fusiformis TaxID=6347 RepID=A0A8J1TY01_OWEFU|nr:unnamed protein product [Owenia fusiformis]
MEESSLIPKYQTDIEEPELGENETGVNLNFSEKFELESKLDHGVHNNHEDTCATTEQVILVYQDELMCSDCGKHCNEVKDFLEHKVEHFISKGIAQCLLCTVELTNPVDLFSHYKLQHNIHDFGHNMVVLDTQGQIVHGDTNNWSSNNINLENPILEDDDPAGVDADVNEDDMQVDINSVTTMLPELSHVEPILDDSNSKKDNGKPKSSKYLKITKKISQDKKDEEGSKPQKDDDFLDYCFGLSTRPIAGKRRHHGMLCFQCLQCSCKFNGVSLLTKHMKAKHGKLDPQILLSPPSERQKNDSQEILTFYDYIKKNHPKKKRVRNVEYQDIPGEYPCPECDKMFLRIRYLRRHMQSHKPGSKVVCDECGKSFRTKAYLGLHMKTHEAKKPYECPECDFKSSMNQAIHKHRQIHNAGSLVCDICGFAYSDKSTLVKHKQVHDLSRPYACTYDTCAWRFKTEVLCRAHIRAHTEEGKFKCTRCGYAFRHKHHLQRHNAKIHGIPYIPCRTNIILPKPPKPDTPPSLDTTNPNSFNFIVQARPDNIQIDPLTQQLVVTTDNDGNFAITDPEALSGIQFIQDAVDGDETARTILLSASDGECYSSVITDTHVADNELEQEPRIMFQQD